MLSQAHPYLSGFLFGLRLLRLLWCCDWGPGARTCHHVLAQREMGLHRCALRFLALCPQEVCYQGDLSLLVTLLTKMYPNSMVARCATTSGDVRRCSLVTWVMWVLHILANCQDFFFFLCVRFLSLTWISLPSSVYATPSKRTNVSQISITWQMVTLNKTVSKPRNLYSTFSGFA